ncbi:hypothetical protein [Flavobacterium sp.]|uniref:hypothetical protein n=1 Tax=Flavobacterium sp. TaxID=239 RepID=UPI004047570C
MNKTLYKSSLNIIEINPNYKFSDLSITNGELKKINDSTYSVLIDTSYQTKLIFKKHKKNHEINFRVNKMPEPELKFWSSDNIDINNITYKEFRNIKAISAILSDFSNSCSFKIISLEIIKIDKNDSEKKIKLNNPNSNDIQRIAIQSNKGDIYIFKNIKIEIEDTKRIINGKDVTIYLK